ncbi:MAG TPA: HemK/PrmC family methyltransferase [Actinomycetota bacterium]
MRAQELVREGERRLKRSPAIDHWPADRERREAAALLAKALGRDEEEPEDLDASVPGRVAARFRRLVRRRAGGEPMGHILGWTEFRGLRFRVRPGAFVPRQSSEWTVEQTVRRLRPRRRPVHVDVATGIGPIALAVASEVPKAQVHGTDLMPEGLRQARSNARELGIRNASFHVGDLLEPLPGRLRGRVDAVTGHIPYVPLGEVDDLPLEVRGFEPEVTLTDYTDHGMSLLGRAVLEARGWLRSGGWLLMEVSPDRSRAVKALMQRAGYGDVRSTKGWPGISRTVVGRWR